MIDESEVDQLVEEALASDRMPEEVCARADLLPLVRERWERCRKVDQRLSALFPSGKSGDLVDESAVDELPKIDGYDVIEVLGRGGVGVVYKARHVRLNRIVAVKMLLSGQFAGRTERLRFQREARVIAGLHHTNIIQIYDVGETGDLPYFSMEQIDGGTLATKLAGVPQTAGAAVDLMITLAGAVESAHAHQIVHRDIKPGNILFTKDGVPKIGDFGLARNVDGQDALTLTGLRVGTPSYMAPEQVSGEKDGVGPAADIYALGAVLYEMLTGRPPFRGESPAETERQLLHDEPVPPNRLNSRVPRDLQTICLKCLRKEPHQRYATAAYLADDLRRFKNGEPIMARSIGRVRRSIKWIRRHPAASVSAFSAALILSAAAGAFFWSMSARASVRRAVDEDLRQAVESQKKCDWTAATAALERAAFRLGKANPDQQRRLVVARHDSELADRLEKIRLSHAGLPDASAEVTNAETDYFKLFQEEGMSPEKLTPDAVADRLSRSAIHDQFVFALDDWWFTSQDLKTRIWTTLTLNAADHDPTGWRDKARDVTIWAGDKSRARDIARDMPLEKQPVSFLIAFAAQLRAEEVDELPFLFRVQQTHSSDFWANLQLGNACIRLNNLGQAARFLQAAVAVRPDVWLAHSNLGFALLNQGLASEAVPEFQRATELCPQLTTNQADYGLALSIAGQHAKAIPQLEQAVRANPKLPLLYRVLGDSLYLTGNYVESAERYQKAVELYPPMLEAQKGLRAALARQGKWREISIAWQPVVASNPTDYRLWAGFCEWCLFQNRPEDYERARTHLLEYFGPIPDEGASEWIARTTLLTPPDPDQLRQATRAIDRAVLGERMHQSSEFPVVMVTKALERYRSAKYSESLDILQKLHYPSLGPTTQLLSAMVLARLNRTDEAKAALAAAISSYDWTPTLADTTAGWMYHVLRREAESTVNGPK